MPDRASILIVDDRPDKLLSLEAVLEDLGQHIVRAGSGRDALREVLRHDFAVILLDVNMPDMDGFETAAMIRQRPASRHTPIIFVTAFSDEMQAARGYELGAVDYILAPVMPEVLRSKVSVFVDLYGKAAQVRRQADRLRHQAERLRRRAGQHQALAAASVAIHGATSVDRLLQVVTDTAREVVGAHQAITLSLVRPAAGQRAGRTQAFGSFSDRYADWRDRPLRLDPVAATVVAASRTATRMTEAQLRGHPDWEVVRQLDIPPIRGGMMAAPLTGRDGTNLGIIYLSDRVEEESGEDNDDTASAQDEPFARGDHSANGEPVAQGSPFANDKLSGGREPGTVVGGFTRDDEAILVQLAQMASIAVENSLYAEEREANRVKDEFLATLSHELRTPLNAILGWTQLLRLQPPMPDGSPPPAADPAEVAHALEVIERNARSQTKLIEDLLDVSRITTGKMRLTGRPAAVGPIVDAACDVVRPTVDAKRVALSCAMEPAAANAVVFGDPDRLQQVFWNLYANAVKFTPAGGRVDSRLERDGDVVRFTVTDSGRGIDPKFLPHVFDRFKQADSSSTRSHGGLGIGLTIVRHIVELHGGTVRADSPGEGAGATFTVTLPLASAPGTGLAADPIAFGDGSSGKPPVSSHRLTITSDQPAKTGDRPAAGPAPAPNGRKSGTARSTQPKAADADADAKPAVPTGNGQSSAIETPAQYDGLSSHGAPIVNAASAAEGGHPAVDLPGTATSAPIDLAGLNVLVVDDDADGREVVRQALLRAGANPMTAASAAEAMDLVRRRRPDVIVSDIAMPDEDGYALIRRVRALPAAAGGETPAVALSAYSREEDRQRALAAGFQAHVAKPVDPAALVAAVAPWARPAAQVEPAGLDSR